MTSRLLPPAEWPKLAALPATLAPIEPASIGANVLVVEQDDQIVGCSVVLTCVHWEGVWIDPAHRRHAAVLRHLLSGVTDTARDQGARGVLASAVEAQIDRFLLDRLHATELPGRHYVVPLHGRCFL